MSGCSFLEQLQLICVIPEPCGALPCAQGELSPLSPPMGAPKGGPCPAFSLLSIIPSWCPPQHPQLFLWCFTSIQMLFPSLDLGVIYPSKTQTLSLFALTEFCVVHSKLMARIYCFELSLFQKSGTPHCPGLSTDFLTHSQF